MEKLLPVIGVLLGWGLKEISDIIRGTIKEKENLNRIIYLLIEIREELGVSTSATYDNMDMFKCTEKQERERLRMEEKFLNIEKIQVKKEKIERAIYYLDPFLSNRVMKAMSALEHIYKLKYTNTSKNRELYIESIANHTSMQQVYYMVLGNILIDISKRHGFFMHRKVKKYLKKETPDKLYDSIPEKLIKDRLPKTFKVVSEYGAE